MRHTWKHASVDFYLISDLYLRGIYTDLGISEQQNDFLGEEEYENGEKEGSYYQR